MATPFTKSFVQDEDFKRVFVFVSLPSSPSITSKNVLHAAQKKTNVSKLMRASIN